jgi:hypothetical protein
MAHPHAKRYGQDVWNFFEDGLEVQRMELTELIQPRRRGSLPPVKYFVGLFVQHKQTR